MSNIVYTIVYILAFVLLATPTTELDNHRLAQKEIKQTINLASKVLVNSIDLSDVSYQVFSLGYYLDNEDLIEVDKDRLVKEFNDVLYKNVLDKGEFKNLQQHIPLLVLTYGDRFYVAEMKMSLPNGETSADSRDKYNVTYVWLPPMFYDVVDDSGRLVFVNLRDETSYYLDAQGQKVELQNSQVRVKGKALTKDVRDQIVIDSINKVVSAKTVDPLEKNAGFEIRIRPDDFNRKDTSTMTHADKEQYYKQIFEISNFNILDGITFFIIYSADTKGYVEGNEIAYRNYNAAGFTLSKRY